VEEAGIPTLTMTVGLDITAHVRPPRAVFLDYPMGNEIGRPHEVEEQRRIVRSAFDALASMTEPGTIVDTGMKIEWDAPDGRPWREWVYTKPFRRHHMKTREGARPE
jgi:hypothetical protein